MMHGPHIPAPNQDMANVSPHLPPDSNRMSLITRRILGSLCVAIGIGVLLNVLLHAIMDADHFASSSLLTSDALAVTAAVCFLIAGATVFLRGVIWSIVLVTCGLFLAILSKWVV